MNARTREQLLELNRVFYEVHAEAFDRSRGARPWPGWERIAALLTDSASSSRSTSVSISALRSASAAPPTAPAADSSSPRTLGGVLDIGCGNARFACFLHGAGFGFHYTGVDANASLLEAARRQLPEACTPNARLILHDFLAGEKPGAMLPAGPFELVVLMGVLHHVPGADWRIALLRSAAARLAPGGRLALATWQFAGDPREERKRVAFESVGCVLGQSIETSELEPGDALLRFGSDPTTPHRYCHAVAASEFASWPGGLGLELVADFRADGAQGESNRYALLRRP